MPVFFANPPPIIDAAPARVRRPLKKLDDPVPATKEPQVTKTQSTPPPEQQIGPAQFEMVDGVLRVSPQPANTPELNPEAVELARLEIAQSGAALVDTLTSLNYDRRLVALIEAMTSRVEEKQDVIQIAIAGIALQSVIQELRGELSSAILGQLNGYVLGINLLVGQYPEWQQFVENAAFSDFDEEDQQGIRKAADDLIAKFEKTPETVDPEVPRTFRAITEAIRAPGKAGRRALFAMIRTIENLAIGISNEVGKLKNSVSDGANKAVKHTTALIVAAAVGAAALQVAPTAFRTLNNTWLEKVAHRLIEANPE